MIITTLQILASNNLLMYCVHSGNDTAILVLLEFEVDLLWKNSTGANLMQVMAKKGCVELAKKCLAKLDDRHENARSAFINNRANNGEVFLKHCNCRLDPVKFV